MGWDVLLALRVALRRADGVGLDHALGLDGVDRGDSTGVCRLHHVHIVGTVRRSQRNQRNQRYHTREDTQRKRRADDVPHGRA